MERSSTLWSLFVVAVTLFAGDQIGQERYRMKARSELSFRGYNPGSTSELPSFFEAARHLGNRYVQLATHDAQPQAPGYSPYLETTDQFSTDFQQVPVYPVYQRNRQPELFRWPR